MNRFFSAAILRQSITWQLDRSLFFRGIVEYNTHYKRHAGDFLTSFTWIPGTVLQSGYESVFTEMANAAGLERLSATQFTQTQRSFFFKASYLWRLKWIAAEAEAFFPFIFCIES
jgi:hypothetical protein